MSEVLHINDKIDFEDVLAENSRVVVDFAAPAWCQPCIKFAPHFEAAAKKSDAVFVAVDIDKADWAVADYGVQSVPTVMLFEDEKYVKNLQERSAIKLLAEIA